LEKLEKFQADDELKLLPICIAKTQYSLSHDPSLSGRPKGWRMPVKDVLIYKGAGLVVPVAGEIKLMPGTSASPAYRRIDVDVETGKVKGLF
jgi:formate--tetrahydrofolate ligase